MRSKETMTKKNLMCLLAIALLTGIFSLYVSAQVTTSEIVGRVTDGQGKPVEGVVVEALHQPSGTNYTAVTNDAGRFALPGMRVGGPYSVKVSQAGFKEQTVNNVQLSLGVAATLNFTLTTAISETVTIEAGDNEIFSESKTGASTAVSTQLVETLPTISRRISDFTRLSPQAGGGGTFAGQDNRLNNITIDGSYFNNSFGLGGQPGDRTGVSPISLDAIEAIQVNISPYDVRQGNFVGAGINTVTRSGTNTYSGSAYYQYRRPGLVGKQAGTAFPSRGNFKYDNWGFRFGGPLPFFNFGEGGPMFTSGKNKLFFFASYENEELTQPGTTFVARTASQTSGGNITRVLNTDLDTLSAYLKNNFNYTTGPYQDYSQSTPAKKFLFRGDYNVNSTNRVSFRYIFLDSSTDVLLSNSSSLGFGTRRTNLTGLNFENSNYQILENIRSYVTEWNSAINSQVSNSLIVGYTKQDESRGYKGTIFPFVDILEAGSVYTSFGFEPFTPNNELRYNSIQIQDNLTFYRGSHTIAAGGSFEHYYSENVFFPGSQSVYVYNSLADFYADANSYLANPNRTTSPVTLRRFQVRWSNIPGLEKPVQPLKVNYYGFYGQDTWKLRDNLSLTYGVRADIPSFAATGFANSQVDGMTFRDENGASVKYSTSKLPDANFLWSPRVGLNWSTFNNKVQVRGGTGIFTARPAYVWISNQIGNNGVLTGFEQLDNITNRGFNPNINAYKPTTVTGAPASSYELALTEANFRFPQIWRTSVGTDVKLPLGLVGGAEFIYSKDVNGIYYINANLPAADSAFTGVDARPRWVSDKCSTVTGTQTDRLNCVVTNAVTLKNQDIGRQWNLSFTIEKPFSKGLWAKAAYSYGEAKNTVDPGSIASGSWQSNQHAGDPNNPGLGFSSATQGHRFFGSFSYRREYFKFGATSVSMFWETRTWGNGSYTFSGDLNGDTGTSNDLIYIPRNTSEMNFGDITSSTGTVLFTAAQQATAWEAFINQDPYLSKNRGKYAQRGAAFLPLVTKVDFSLSQDLIAKFGNTRHSFQIRADILNFGNLLNHNWGLGQAFNQLQPLVPSSSSSTSTCRIAATTAASYCLRTSSGNLLAPTSYIPTGTNNDVYRVQLGFRYTFN